MVFLAYSFPSSLERSYLEVFGFGLLINEARCDFAHLAL
jgi:hypothetical protein